MFKPFHLYYINQEAEHIRKLNHYGCSNFVLDSNWFKHTRRDHYITIAEDKNYIYLIPVYKMHEGLEKYTSSYNFEGITSRFDWNHYDFLIQTNTVFRITKSFFADQINRKVYIEVKPLSEPDKNIVYKAMYKRLSKTAIDVSIVDMWEHRKEETIIYKHRTDDYKIINHDDEMLIYLPLIDKYINFIENNEFECHKSKLFTKKYRRPDTINPKYLPAYELAKAFCLTNCPERLDKIEQRFNQPWYNNTYKIDHDYIWNLLIGSGLIDFNCLNISHSVIKRCIRGRYSSRNRSIVVAFARIYHALFCKVINSETIPSFSDWQDFGLLFENIYSNVAHYQENVIRGSRIFNPHDLNSEKTLIPETLIKFNDKLNNNSLEELKSLYDSTINELSKPNQDELTKRKLIIDLYIKLIHTLSFGEFNLVVCNLLSTYLFTKYLYPQDHFIFFCNLAKSEEFQSLLFNETTDYQTMFDYLNNCVTKFSPFNKDNPAWTHIWKGYTLSDFEAMVDNFCNKGTWSI